MLGFLRIASLTMLSAFRRRLAKGSPTRGQAKTAGLPWSACCGRRCSDGLRDAVGCLIRAIACGIFRGLALPLADRAKMSTVGIAPSTVVGRAGVAMGDKAGRRDEAPVFLSAALVMRV